MIVRPHSWRLIALASLVVAELAVASRATAVPAAEQVTPAAVPDAGRDASPAVPDAASCIQFWGQPQGTGYGYRHVVVVRNDCAKAAECLVWTDVAPSAIAAVVPSKSTLEVVTFVEATVAQFTPTVRCKL